MGSRWLEPSEYEAAVCAELRPALTLLEQRYGTRITKVHLDMKASITDVYLAGAPPEGVIAWLERTLPANEHRRFWPKGAVSCQRCFTSIEWSDIEPTPAPPAKKPWWRIW